MSEAVGMIGTQRGYVDGFDLRIEVVSDGDVVVLRSATLTASEGSAPRALDRSTWIAVGWPDIYEAVDEFLTTTGPMRELIPPALRKAAERSRPGRRGRPDLFYAERVAEFFEAIEHEPRTPIKWLVENVEWPVPEPKPRSAESGRLSSDDPKSKQWRVWIKEAEKRGLIADRPAELDGRTGGRMTDRCRQLLDEVGAPAERPAVDPAELAAAIEHRARHRADLGLPPDPPEEEN